MNLAKFYERHEQKMTQVELSQKVDCVELCVIGLIFSAWEVFKAGLLLVGILLAN